MRYADDFVCCFEYKAEAQEFFVKLQERLAKFKLEIAVSYTHLDVYKRQR